MTYQVKLPYYPQDIVYLSETRFGAKKISKPRIYETPLSGRFVVKVDTLKSLSPLIGDEVFCERDLLFDIVSGETETGDYNKLVSSFYHKYKGFMSYVNDRYHYGDDTVPIIDRSVLPLRQEVNNYSSEMSAKLSNMGGKFLVNTHDYLYYMFRTKPDITDFEGVTLIC